MKDFTDLLNTENEKELYKSMSTALDKIKTKISLSDIEAPSMEELDFGKISKKKGWGTDTEETQRLIQQLNKASGRKRKTKKTK